MVLEFPFDLEKLGHLWWKKKKRRRKEEEEEKMIRRRIRKKGEGRRKKEEGKREVQEFKVWILVKDLYGIHVGLGIFQPLYLSICRLGNPNLQMCLVWLWSLMEENFVWRKCWVLGEMLSVFFKLMFLFLP